ncbi:hypothetical protein ANRL1_02250 [Anaerolineae bacterium]|nr:hypothetical protein ANRL1_02250 [Anaerolineae bacterium]
MSDTDVLTNSQVTEIEDAALEAALGLLGDAMASDRIELPFAAGFAWVINGEAMYANQVKTNDAPPAAYFGGFAADLDAFEAVHATLGMGMPKSWSKFDKTNRQGKTYGVYCARSLVIAPMGYRESWQTEDRKTRYPKYTEGCQRHIQILAQAALMLKDEATGGVKFVPWMPMVVSTRGTQCARLLGAVNDWNAKTRPLRAKLGTRGKNPFVFWIRVGTFGDRKQEMVGKVKQSPITPITLDVPTELNEQTLAARYVGNDMVLAMAEMTRASAEWLNAWKKISTATSEALAPTAKEEPEKEMALPEEW